MNSSGNSQDKTQDKKMMSEINKYCKRWLGDIREGEDDRR